MSPAVPAAVYLRMSTEHQQYSLENQFAAIKEYAAVHGFNIVATYSDAAISGLTLRKRPGLQQLLEDVASPHVPFQAILVYDVSRWGRFQDTDESAYYEFRCKAAGVPVHYCAESFKNDGTIPSTIMKALKRTMAGEYSRELGVKVLAGQKFSARLGFKQGGIAGYGLRRIQVSENRERKQTLNKGERKNVLTDRVILGLGPTEEVETVREIYRMLVVEGRTIYRIARELNRRGIPYLGGKQWRHFNVKQIVTHPKYAGCCVFNRCSHRLDDTKNTPVPESDWVTVPNAYEAIVDRPTFDQAQRILRNRTIAKSNEDLLDGLRKLLAEKGRLTSSIIDRSPDVPSVNVYHRRFGGLLKAYDLIGYRAPAPDLASLKVRFQTLIMREELVAQLVRMFPDQLSVVRRSRRWRAQFRLQNGPLFSLQIAKMQARSKYVDRWRITPIAHEQQNITLLARLNPTNDAFQDFWVLPSLDCKPNLHIGEYDVWLNRGRRLPDLSQLPQILREVDRRKQSQANRPNTMNRWSLKGAQFI